MANNRLSRWNGSRNC